MTKSEPQRGARSVDQIDEAANALMTAIGTGFETAVVLGSGLGALAGRIVDPQVVSYADLPHWPVPGITGHAGQVVAGRLRGRPIIALSGRVHAYEGHPSDVLTFAVRVLGRAGVRHLILTNAAGGINLAFSSGTLMVIDDHINATGFNPLVGPNDPRLGRRFPDMSEIYSRRLRRIADEASAAVRVPVAHGVYVGVLGPSYETPAEIRAFRVLGADAVGMSTVPEAIAARHMEMEVLGLSCIANKAAEEGALLLEEDVLATAAGVQESFIQLVEEIVVRL